MSKNVIMPRNLTAENGAKSAMMGEFTIRHTAQCSGCYYDEPQEDCEVCCGEVEYTEYVVIPWTTIKDIYELAVQTVGKEL